MKRLFIVFVCLALACNKKEETVKQLGFYGKHILVPAYLISDSTNINADDFCESNLYLKNKEETTFMSFELCSYRYGKRPNFNILNSFFQEECSTLEEEVIGLSWINKESFDRTDYYEFTFDIENGSKFFHVTYFAYENYYLTVKINGIDRNQIIDLLKSSDILRNNNFLHNMIISKDELENYCLNCKFPTFW